MSFTTLSPLVVGLGLAGLAGLLYALQRLRVRHQEVTVVTTLFWKEAVEEARARVLVKRFRHPWAYVLLLSIAALLWIAIAGPSASAGDAKRRVLVLDGSARMQGGTRFTDALAAVRARAAELPRASTKVVLAGAFPTTLLDAGEELVLLDERARGLAPDTTAVSVECVLASLAAEAAPEAGRVFEVFTPAPVEPALVAHLTHAPEAQATSRTEVVQHALAPLGANAGIVALGASPARSGAWDRVDVYAASNTKEAAALTGVEGAALEDARTADGRAVVIARDVVARGGRVEARVEASPSDALATDDRAALVLPDHPILRVAVSPTLSAENAGALRAAVAADPGLALADDAANADVVLRAAGDAFGAGRPAFELSEPSNGAAAFVLARPATDDPERELARAFDDLGLAEIDAVDLAQRAAKPLELVLVDAPERRVSVWAELLDARYDFTRSRSFPLFVGRALRWLAGASPLEPVVAAGELRLGDERAFTTAARATEASSTPQPSETSRSSRPSAPTRPVRYDPVGSEARLPRAGDYADERGVVLAASVLDRATTSPAPFPAGTAVESAPSAGASALAPIAWLVLAALALLLVEWFLSRTDRIP